MDGYNRPIFQFALREDLKDNREFLPAKGEPLATGYDVRAAFEDRQPLLITPFQHVRIPLGFRTFCQSGWWYELKPRSSSFAKKHLQALYGTIDQTYERELIFACQYIPNLDMDYSLDAPYFPNWKRYCGSNVLEIKFGEAIGQIIPVARQEMAVHEVSNEEYDKLCKMRSSIRGTGGFGSTDGK